MDKNTQEQFNKLAKVFNTDNVITAKEIEQVLVGIMQIMNFFKKDNEKLTAETKQVVEILFERVIAEHAKLSKQANDTFEQANSSLLSKLETTVGLKEKKIDAKIKQAENLIAEIKAIEVKDGKDADEDRIIAEIIAQIKFPEVIKETGETIVDKINLLGDDVKIDASHIKNLPITKTGYSPTVLGNAVDLNQSARADGYAIVWDDTTKNFKFSPSGGGAVTDLTGTPTEIPYFDALGNGTSDADHTLLADGTLRLASTHGDVTGRFYQGDEPLIGNLHVWGKFAEDAVTGSLAADIFIDGTASAEFGNDIALIRAAQFASTNSGYSETIYSGGIEKNMGLASGNFYIETVFDDAYKMYYSDEATSGGLIWGSTQGIGILSQDWTSYAAGYPVDSFFGQVFADNTGISTRVGLGKDHVDYVQVGTIISVVTFTGGGLDDFTPGGTYTGSFTGTYTVGCVGNNGARVVFNGGMTTGQQFAVGEVVTGSISGATAVVSDGISDTRIWVYDVTGTGFVVGDILTGDQGNVSTAVTTAGNAPGVGDLFQINYNDLSNNNIDWFTGNQSPFASIGGITFAFASPTGHMQNDNWAFTASANYDEKQKVDITGTVFPNNANGTSTHSQDIPITVKYTLTAGQLATIGSAPVEVVPAPGAGYMIQQISAYSKYNFNTTNFVQGGALLVTRYTNDAVGAGNTFFLNGGSQVITATGQTNPYTLWGYPTAQSQGPTTLENQGISIQTDDVSDPTGAGDGTLDFYITYKVIAL